MIRSIYHRVSSSLRRPCGETPVHIRRHCLVHCRKTQVIGDQTISDGMNVDEYCCFLKKEKEKHFENDKKQSINENENGLVPTSRPMMCRFVGHHLVT